MSGKIINIKRLEETTIWRKLQSLNDSNATSLIGVLPTICEEASDRMKVMPNTSPQYTLHDESHFLRVVELMAMVLGKTLDELNSIELCLLILTAYYHDQGMVMSKDEYENLSSNDEFQLFRDTWYINHPNYKEIQTQLQDLNINYDERNRLSKLLSELDAGLLTDYLRVTHAKRSSDYVIETFSNDKRLVISNINLSNILAKLCESHYSHTHELTTANGFNHDEQIGLYKINMPFIAIVLRLADILDFDADRTPDVLFRTIHFSSDISLQEWEKHRGIQGWEINESLVRFTAKYDHPAYQAAAFKFMDWIDKELSECQTLCRSVPAQFEHYKLLLPSSVDRSRIQPKDNGYIYHDLEIGLSRNEIVKLLMTDELYDRPYFCIRELLQNSLDALRYRKALFTCAEIEWNEGRVDFFHSLDKDGYEIIQCKDNGAGMDKDIVTRFLTNAGRSFYRSPDFERERVNFRKKNIDYDPCSQFGIGFMSCFMLGDRIKIETRRDYGQGKSWGKPLIIEINGLGSLIVIRDGSSSQKPGTTVTITSRKKPSFLDAWNDKVRLTDALKCFSIATEFPITGQCDIEELKDSVEILTTPSHIPTLIEKSEINKKLFITRKYKFNDIDNLLNGEIRESFLIDEKGLPALSNEAAIWKFKSEEKARKSFVLICGETIHESRDYYDSQISIDGIHLCGVWGRPEWQQDKDLEFRMGSRPSHIYSLPYSLDVRGNLKPEITPARVPFNDSSHNLPPKWKVLKNKVHQAAGKIWELLIKEFISKGLTDENLYKLLVAHNGNICDIPLTSLWQNFLVPLISEKKTKWVRLSNLNSLTIQENGEDYCFVTKSGQTLKLPSSIDTWEKSGVDHPYLQRHINYLIIALSSLTIQNEKIKYTLAPPDNDQLTANSLAISRHYTHIPVLRYVGEVKDIITVQSSNKTANSSHPLVQQCLKSEKPNSLNEFASSFIPCIIDTINSEKQERSIEKPDRWMKYSAHCYFAVDWSKYEDGLLKPPYKILLKNGKTIEISTSDLKAWRDTALDS